MNPLVIIFITWLMIIKVVFWAKKTAQNLHLDNQPPWFFFTMGFMPPTHTTGVNFRFIAFAFQPRRAKYDLGIMRADRVRYGQVVISHFMKKNQTGAVYQIMSFRFCGLGVFTVSVNLRVEKQNSLSAHFIFNSSPQRGIPLDFQKPKTEIGLGVIFGVVEISLFCG